MNVLDELRQTTKALEDAEFVVFRLKQQRDAQVSAARDERIGYAEIKDATGMSISWINASLVRTDGYRPRAGRPRRREVA
jgi:hypothetical protein